ncbi:unnamed protein product [Calicophoron daubneyi]|uniref:Major facilitator superfamily (MFS) profile domain-containing protein n=1 Tax=Calicophoron daubneyi TaxID=300641 RepID=A0AAV2T451_CALDB
MWTETERYSWMFCLFCGSIGLYACRAVLPICSVAINAELDWNRREMGIVMGVFFWGYALTQILAGYLSDRLGGELVISISSLVWSLVNLSFVFLPRLSSSSFTAFYLFVFARFALGVFQGFYYPSLASMMAVRVRPVVRNFTYAVVNAGAHLGTLLCGSVGSYLVVSHGWRAPFALIGVLCSVWSLTTYFRMVRPLAKKWQEVPMAPSLFHDDSAGFSSRAVGNKSSTVNLSAMRIEVSPKVTTTHSDNAIPFDWRILARYPPFWVMLLANFVHNNSFYIILNWCPSYFHDNYPNARSWVFNMVPWLIIFPSVLLSGVLADRWTKQGVPLTLVRKLITTVVLFGSSVFLLLLCYVEDYYLSLACMALALACLGFHCSGVLLNPQDMAPHHGGQVYGVMATVGTFPGFFSVYLAGYLLESTHQWSVIFIFTSLFSLVGWIAYIKYASSDPVF